MSINVVSKCKSPKCGKRVLYSNELAGGKGRPHIYDPPKVCRACDGSGKVQQIDLQMDLFAGNTAPRMVDVTCRACKGRGKAWVSHYKTCPDADAFRWKRKETADR